MSRLDLYVQVDVEGLQQFVFFLFVGVQFKLFGKEFDLEDY